MSRCDQFRLLMVDAIYQSDSQQDNRLQQHIAECSDCRQSWAELRRTREFLQITRSRESDGAELGPTTGEIIQAAKRYSRTQWLKQASGWMVAAILAVALLANGSLRNGNGPEALTPASQPVVLAPLGQEDDLNQQALVQLMLEVNGSLQRQITEVRNELTMISDELQREKTSKALLLASLEEMGESRMVRN